MAENYVFAFVFLSVCTIFTSIRQTIATLKAQAAGQLRRYAADEKVQKSKGHTTLRLLTLLFRGWELEAEELL